MGQTLQNFLAGATTKAMTNLIAAVERIPDDKKNWSPMGDARSALDQAAECAILGEGKLLITREWPKDWSFEDYLKQKAELVSQGWPAVKSLLETNIPKGVEAIKSISDEDLDVVVEMPWGPFTLAQLASYPSWNMSYHEGQCNYIAMMLGVME